MSRIQALLVSAAIFVGGLSLLGVGQAAEPSGPILTPWPVETLGQVTTEMGSGGVLLRPDSLSGVGLQAERVTIETDWEQGHDARLGGSVGKVVREQGRESHRFTDAILWFEPTDRGGAVFLAYTGEDGAHFSLASQRGTVFSTAEAGMVLAVGTSTDSVEAGDPEDLRFEYRTEGPVVQATGKAMTIVEGDFTLFLHEVLIHVEEDEVDWSQWTGYREMEPESPVTGYEMRLTKIYVEEGIFVTSTQPVTALSPAADVHLEGVLTTPEATGRLLDGQKLLVFDRDPLRIEGEGTVHISTEVDHWAARQIAMVPTGEFQIQGAGRVESTGHSGPTLQVSAAWPLGAVAGAIVVSLGLIRAGWVPAPTAASRTQRSTRWNVRGDKAWALDDLGGAARCYAKAVRIKEDEPYAWFRWAETELKRGDPAAAELIASNAVDVPGLDHLDLLALRATAAWLREDHVLFDELIAALTAEAPEMAQRVVHENGTGRQVPAQEDPLVGYA